MAIWRMISHFVAGLLIGGFAVVQVFAIFSERLSPVPDPLATPSPQTYQALMEVLAQHCALASQAHAESGEKLAGELTAKNRLRYALGQAQFKGYRDGVAVAMAEIDKGRKKDVAASVAAVSTAALCVDIGKTQTP